MESTISAPSRSSSPTAGYAFDSIAAAYDDIFTSSLIGRAQRDSVWKTLTSTFKKGDNVLELNCGTGEDALFLAGQGISVFACDASERMIARAEQRLLHMPSRLPAVFCHLPTEHINTLQPVTQFDGAFSNFSGLNCIRDLSSVAASLSALTCTKGQLLLCFSTRICLLEILHYAIRGQFKKALRRCGGETRASLGGVDLPVYYPTLRQIRKSFSPYFKVKSFRGVGVAIPPSYCEDWARKHRSLFKALCSVENLLTSIPVLRVTGDHVLICLEKVAQ